MSAQLQDIGLPLLTVAVLSPVAILCFRYGVPIELIVFGLLCAGYRGPKWCRRAAKGGDKQPDSAAPASPVPETPVPASKKTKGSGSFPSWRPWKGKDREADMSSPAWRKPETKAKGRPAAQTEARPKSGAAFLKKNASQTQWRSIINKFTPEKFDKLCEQLLCTLPVPGAADAGAAEKTSCCDTEFGTVLEDLLSLIFDACSRQHQYTEMYTDLCQQLLDHVARERPNLDGRARVWGRCQHIFHSVVLKTPEIPMDLPEDEYMDRKAKIKEKMVGMVKFGGDLVSRGLVPAEGVMTWIHTLLSEKSQEVYSPLEGDEDEAFVQEAEKDVEQREVQLEVLCAILASMGSSLSDPTVWNEENRLVIEDVFEQLEQLSIDADRLSLRIRCLIRDVLDLRTAHWKEKAGKLKPTALQHRHKDEEYEKSEKSERVETNLRSEAPEFVPGSRGGSVWTSDRLLEGKPWLDPQLLASLEVVEHHLEVIEDRDAKLQRLKALIQLYFQLQEKQVVVVANTLNVRRILEMIAGSFGNMDLRCLDQNTPEAIRLQSLKSFQMGQVSMLLMTTDVSARRDFDFGKAAPVLVNYDFPMTLQLYLYRIQKRADSHTHVYTFFSPHDVRHAASLLIVLEAAHQKVPDALRKMKDQAKADSAKKDAGSHRRGKGDDDAQDAERRGQRPRNEERRWESGRDSRRPAGDGESSTADRHANHRRAGQGHTGQRSHPDEGRRPPASKDRWNDAEPASRPSAAAAPYGGSGPRQRRPEGPTGNGSPGFDDADGEPPVRILNRGERLPASGHKGPPLETRNGPRSRPSGLQR